MQTALDPEFAVIQAKNREASPISRFPLPPSTQKSSNYKGLAGQFPIQPNREFWRRNREAWAGNRDLSEVIRDHVFGQGSGRLLFAASFCASRSSGHPSSRTPMEQDTFAKHLSLQSAVFIGRYPGVMIFLPLSSPSRAVADRVLCGPRNRSRFSAFHSVKIGHNPLTRF